MRTLLFFMFCTLVQSSCVQDKKSVEPYRDSTYTTSVAQVRTSNPKSIAVPDKSKTNTTIVEPSVRQHTSLSEKKSSDTMLPLLTLVDDRIVAYEGKNEQWEKFSAEALTINLDEEQLNNISACQNQLMNVLTGYNDLHQQLISESNGRADGTFIEGFLPTERAREVIQKAVFVFKESNLHLSFEPQTRTCI